MSSPNPIKAAVPAARALLSVRRLRIAFEARRRVPWSHAGAIQAVEDVHFDLAPGDTLGVLGEAGCGKTTLARALAGLQPIDSGGVVYASRDLMRSGEGWRPVRRSIQMLFADSRGSLDPRMTIGESILEFLEELCPELDAAARTARVSRALAGVDAAGLEGRRPGDLTEEQCRSVCLARALAVRPEILICDEPGILFGDASGANLLALLREEQRGRSIALVLIGAEAEVMKQLCQRVLVMSLGRILEQGETAELLERPRHPYTRALLAGALGSERPDPANPPSGCVFRTRCPMADELCAREVPYLRRVSESGHAACHYVHGTSGEDEGEAVP